jgi:hypothetical protein
MPAHIRRGNAARGRVRAAVEHVLAAQELRLRLVVRRSASPARRPARPRQTRLPPAAPHLAARARHAGLTGATPKAAPHRPLGQRERADQGTVPGLGGRNRGPPASRMPMGRQTATEPRASRCALSSRAPRGHSWAARRGEREMPAIPPPSA